MTVVAKEPLVAALLVLAGCTYGPLEHAAAVKQVLRLGDTDRAFVVVGLDTFRRPTGLSAFPDGGKWRYARRPAAEYLVDARQGDVVLLAEQDAPTQVWESFESRIVGLEGDTAGYLQLSGCPKGGECTPSRHRVLRYRLTVDGAIRQVESLPGGARLPGQMVARRPGEGSCVRFGILGDTVTGRFEEAGQARPLFRVRPDGSLVTVDR